MGVGSNVTYKAQSGISCLSTYLHLFEPKKLTAASVSFLVENVKKTISLSSI
jgi:hypothetical protein